MDAPLRPDLVPGKKQHRTTECTYLPPETGADWPTEFVSTTDTVPIALVSPLNVNGSVSEKAPPLAIPLGLANHAAASVPNWAVQLGVQPLICAPDAAVSTNIPLIRSRGEEVPSTTT